MTSVKDPYQLLGVSKGAAADQIKQSYRRLARELHPDLNPGDAKAEERFKDISAAYDFLSDDTKRGQYDRGEIDASGQPLRRAHCNNHRNQAGANPFKFEFGNDPDEIMAEMMRRKEKGKKSWGSAWGFGAEEPKPKTGSDAHHTLKVSFADAANGTTKRVTLATGKSVDVRIPPGSADGQSLRLKGQGFPSNAGGPAGDAYIDIKVDPHTLFERRDQDIILELPISVIEAVQGAKITVPTSDGQVMVTVPPGSNTGTILRLKGKGIKQPNGTTGDQLVKLLVELPENDVEFAKLVEKWGAKAAYNPRTKLGI